MALAQLESHFNLARLEQGGMQVLTTLDYDLQMRTKCALQTQLSRLNNPGGTAPQACEGAESLPPLPWPNRIRSLSNLMLLETSR